MTCVSASMAHITIMCTILLHHALMTAENQRNQRCPYNNYAAESSIATQTVPSVLTQCASAEHMPPSSDICSESSSMYERSFAAFAPLRIRAVRVHGHRLSSLCGVCMGGVCMCTRNPRSIIHPRATLLSHIIAPHHTRMNGNALTLLPATPCNQKPSQRQLEARLECDCAAPSHS